MSICKKYINNIQSNSKQFNTWRDLHMNRLNMPTILCNKNNNTTFKFNDICIFKINLYGKLLPCNGGNHLENCVNFQCSTHFKMS